MMKKEKVKISGMAPCGPGIGWVPPMDGRPSHGIPPGTNPLQPGMSMSEEIFIAEFLAGFLLLHRSGLDPSEKSNILGSIKGQFNTNTAGKALRTVGRC